MDIEKNLEEFQKIIGYEFKNKSLLKLALTHTSFANELKINRYGDNERLEFLGDAVLELTSSDKIFKEHPEMSEGQMTRLRASIVCEPTLALCAREIGLDQHILLGKGEEMTGGRGRDSIVSDAFEAVIGAIYMDGGIANAKEYILKFVFEDIEDKTLFYDSKTTLQEVVQSLGLETEYSLVSTEGPQHNMTFTAQAKAGDLFCMQGTGHTKKAAEQQAAYQALLKLKKDGVFTPSEGK